MITVRKIILLVITLCVNWSLQATEYDYAVNLQIHNFNNHFSKAEIEKEIQRTQAYFDRCKIKINIESYREAHHPLLDEWESYWYNSDEITEYEEILKGPEFKKKVNIVFVDSLNWTIDGQGTWALAYASYLAEKLPPTDVQFLKDHLFGTIVMGRHRARWTLAHELGHLLFGLMHTAHPQNIMQTGTGFEVPKFDQDGLYISNKKVSFSQKQCDDGTLEGEYIFPINR